MAKYAAALDQGTTSSRCMVFDHGGQVVSVAQKEHEQIYPKPGWVEHDATEVWSRTQEVMDEALADAGASADDIAGVGITNQRETTLVWDRNTGEPVHNALVWQDTRTDKLVDEFSKDGGQARFQERVGLPLATYFSGPKIRWILDNVDGAQDKAESGDLLFGNMDTWLIWNLTGGTDGGLHITDVTNASRTMLMDLGPLQWDEEIAGIMGVPDAMLPEIKALERGLRRGEGGRGAPGRRDRRRPRRPAGGHLRADLLRRRRGQEHLRHGQLPPAQHGHGAGAVEERAAHHRRLQDRRRGRRVLPRGLHRHHRRAGAVAARQPEDDPGRAGGRGPGEVGRRQRRLLHRARVLGAVRALLEVQRSRRDGGAHPLRQRRATSHGRRSRRRPTRAARSWRP